jgi:putative ABC transport system permease protein
VGSKRAEAGVSALGRLRLQLAPLGAEAINQLRANWRSHALTLSGIVWGAAAVILLLALGVGFDDFLDMGLEKSGGRWITLEPGFTTAASGGRRPGRLIHFDDEDLARLRAGVSSASAIAGESQYLLSVETPARVRASTVSAASPELGKIQKHRVARGRYLSAEDEIEGRRVAALGANLAQFFFGNDDPLGQRLQIGGVPFEVIGVLERKGLQFVVHREPHDWMIFVPLSAGRRAVAKTDEIKRIYLNPWSIADEPALRAEARDTIARLHHLFPDDREAIRVLSIPEMSEPIRKIILATHVALGLIGTVMLAMAGIGLANLMTALIHERSREFAMRRACGARRSDIVLQLLGESTIVALIGGGVGVALALLALVALDALPLPPEIPRPRVSPSVLVTTFTILVATGLATGVLPARLAARVDPSAALRVT